MTTNLLVRHGAGALGCALLLAVVSCGSNDTYSPTLDGGQMTGLTMTIEPGRIVAPIGTLEGGYFQYKITVRTTDGSSRAVKLSAAPVGSTSLNVIRVTPSEVNTGSPGAQATLEMGPADGTPRRCEARVTATLGSVSVYGTVRLTITGFSLEVSPGTQRLSSGGTAQYTVTLTPLPADEPFEGNADLRMGSGLPKGVTGTLDPATLTFDGTAAARTSTLTLTAEPGLLTETTAAFNVVASGGTFSVVGGAEVELNSPGNLDGIIK